MSNWKLSQIVGLLVFAGVLGGCGGAGAPDSGTRGEGNIPIGRIEMPPGQVQVTATYQNMNTVQGSVDGDGVVWMPLSPVGTASLSIQPADTNLEPVAFDMAFGIRQEYVVDATINEKKPSAVVTGLDIELVNGKTPVVGKSYPVKVTVSGTGVSGLKATVWVEGDVGYVDKNHKFHATYAGTGVIRATLRGVTSQLAFNVN